MTRRFYRPHIMVFVSVVALVITLLITALAILDQTKRINDPVSYAEKRCRGELGATASPSELAPCVSKEEKKSTLVSVAPLLVAGIIVGGIGVAGLFVGREEVRRYNEVVRKLKGED